MYIGCIQSVKGSSARIFLNAITLRYTKCGEFTGQLSDYHLLSRDSISLSYSVHKRRLCSWNLMGSECLSVMWSLCRITINIKQNN